MIKALFVDYYGTIVYEISPVAVEVIKRVYATGNAKSMEEILGYWWKVFREKLAGANGPTFRTQHDIALDSFRAALPHFQSSEDADALLDRMEEHWKTSPAYDDAAMFMQSVPYPVYFVTNSDDNYILENMQNNNIHPAGIITSEQARYSKPRPEIFNYALEKTGFKSDEVIHIGDSLDSDVECPQSVGIKALFLNREKKEVPDGVASVNDLSEALDYIRKI